jgi:hypothetical protein
MAGINYTISADASKANREMSSFEKKTRKIVDSIAKGFKERIGHKLFDGLIGAARSVPGMLGEAIDSASSLNEEISKSETIFGNSSAEIQKWAKGAADAMGLSEVAALEATGTIGNMFTAMGMSGDEAASMSKSMVQLASDLGSFNNTSTDDAIQAIGAALRGESEPIRRYGVLLDDATLKAEALAKGLYNGKGSLDPATRALSAYSVILKQTTSAQGDFQKTSDGLANSQKILEAQFANASTEIGKALLPAMQSLVNLMREIDWQSVGKDVGEIAKMFITLADNVGSAYTAFKNFAEQAMITSGILDDIKKSTPDMSRFAGEFETPKKTEEELRFDRGTQALLEADARRKTLSLQDQAIEKNKEESRSIWQIIEDSKKMADEKVKAIRAEIRERTREEKAAISMTEAQALAEFGMGGAAVKANRIEELRKQGITGKDAEEIANREGDVDKLMRTRDMLSSMASRSSITAVSSMQRIGGGGGVSTQLDYQKRQAQLQEQMVSLLSEIKERQKPQSISDY